MGGVLGDGLFDEGVELFPFVELLDGLDGFGQILAGFRVGNGHELVPVVVEGILPKSLVGEFVALVAEGRRVLRQGRKSGEKKTASEEECFHDV